MRLKFIVLKYILFVLRYIEHGGMVGFVTESASDLIETPHPILAYKVYTDWDVAAERFHRSKHGKRKGK